MKKHGYTSLNHDLFVDIPTAEDWPSCRGPRSDRHLNELGAGRLLGMTERSVPSSREYDKQKDCSEKLSPIACTTDVSHALASRLELGIQVSNHHDLSVCRMADHIWTFPRPSRHHQAQATWKTIPWPFDIPPN